MIKYSNKTKITGVMPITIPVIIKKTYWYMIIKIPVIKLWLLVLFLNKSSDQSKTIGIMPNKIPVTNLVDWFYAQRKKYSKMINGTK